MDFHLQRPGGITQREDTTGVVTKREAEFSDIARFFEMTVSVSCGANY